MLFESLYYLCQIEHAAIKFLGQFYVICFFFLKYFIIKRNGYAYYGREICLRPQQRNCSLCEWAEETDATLTNLFNPTSGRDASHTCLISLSLSHECTTTIHMWSKSQKLPYACTQCTRVALASKVQSRGNSGTIMSQAQAYKACVGGVSPQCGIEQICEGGIGLLGPFPKRTIPLLGSETNLPPTFTIRGRRRGASAPPELSKFSLIILVY